MSPRVRLLQVLQQLDLRGKITLALLSASLAMGAVVTLSTYLIGYYTLTEHTKDLLNARAQLEQREIELRLASVVSLAESLASNTVTANALADSRGRETYLEPLLRNQNLGVSGAELTVVDYRGRPAASSLRQAPDYRGDPLFAALMSDGLAKAQVSTDDAGPSSLVVMLPIRYLLTGNVEGGVILRVPFAPLLGTSDWADSRWLVDRHLQTLAGKVAGEDAFELASMLLLPPPLDSLGLELVLARDRAQAFRALDFLLMAFVAVGVLVISGVVAFARVGARYITAPLAEVAAAAEKIAASGRPVAQLPVRRGDDFGRLSAAFNTMVDRLRQSYGELEDLVAERTRDYEESKEEAERASNLLREAVQSIAVGFTIYDENDRLVLCNESYLGFYEDSRDLIVPGATFADIVRRGAERGQYKDAIGNIDAWVAERVALHQRADGEQIEQRLGDGRWLLVIEHRTPSGFIVGNRIDITELKVATEALRVREAYQRATLDNLPFYFWLKDAGGRFLAVNKVFAEACGRGNPDEIAGLTDFDVWPTERAERNRADDKAVMDSRRDSTIEEPLAEGSEDGWVEVYRKPVIAVDGRILGTVGFARDISERKRMERALEESEQRFELSVRGANDGIWDWNPATGEAMYSERWKSMLGYSVEDIGNDIDDWRALVHPDDLEEVLEKMKAHLCGQTEFYSTELRLRCKDGSYKWILCRGKALFDESGNPVRMSGSHTDVTERRAAEARILDRTEQLNAIFALSPDGFVSFDAERRVKYVSPAFRRMTGLDEADVAGLDEVEFSARLAGECIEQARFPGIEALRAAATGRDGQDARSGRRQLIEMASAGKRVLEVGVRLSQAETVSQILYLRDVTHETEVDRMKSEFLSTAAHELRTPMACIYGFSELLAAQEFPPEERQEYLRAIHSQAELMVSIINELLDLARIEARRGKDFHFARIDANGLLREIVANFKAPNGREGPQQSLDAGPAWVRADGKKLTQAVNNVLSNAYKYSPEGGEIRIELVESARSEASAPRIGIRVTDCGIGMTAAQLERVCERFYRADTSGKIPGTGLGMSIVKEIVELHGGEMGLTSQPGAGTTVTLWIPAAPDLAAGLPLPAACERVEIFP